jgi:soluble lytic murein transglycosylase-like protein
LQSPSLAQSYFPDRYDRQIKQASERWLPGVPWRLWKAQLYQESKLDPNASSPAGAEGLAQFMGPTWGDIAPALGYGLADRRLVGPAIDGGAYYMAALSKRWRALRQWQEVHRHAQGGYNAGNGNIGRAWRLCAKPEVWDLTIICLPEITGRHSSETISYVDRIWMVWWPKMEIE